jgi:hypothetical protein
VILSKRQAALSHALATRHFGIGLHCAIAPAIWRLAGPGMSVMIDQPAASAGPLAP